MKSSFWRPICAFFIFVTFINGDCEFPEKWFGTWFQLGFGTVTINSTFLSSKGSCKEARGSRFLVEESSNDRCLRCIVIHENHQNVLQFKETFCVEGDLESICGNLEGDSQLYLMIRIGDRVSWVPCPLRGAPFTFYYTRGGQGPCNSPMSTIDGCTDPSKLLLRYQACHNVPTTESAEEELHCLADWKVGSQRYFVAKVSMQNKHLSIEESYRCFIFEHVSPISAPGEISRGSGPSSVAYYLAQSADASCSGLSTIGEGSKTMTLFKADVGGAHCHFPGWMTNHRKWHSLDYTFTYHVGGHNGTIRVTDHVLGHESRLTCHSLVSSDKSSHQMTFVVHAISGCNTTYICMIFYKRDGYVVEIQQTSQLNSVPEDTCKEVYLIQESLPFLTLATSSLHPRKCPHLGRYRLASEEGGVVIGPFAQKLIENPTNSGHSISSENTDISSSEPEPIEPECSAYHTLTVGCSHSGDTMEFQSDCPRLTVQAYSCHGSWSDNDGSSYVIASPTSRHSTGAKRLCFVYSFRPTLRLSSVTETCMRKIHGEKTALTFNLTAQGKCTEANMSTTVVLVPSLCFIITLILTLLSIR